MCTIQKRTHNTHTHCPRVHTYTCMHTYTHTHGVQTRAPTCSARLEPGVGLQKFLGSLSSAPRPPALQEAGTDAATPSGAHGPPAPCMSHSCPVCLQVCGSYSPEPHWALTKQQSLAATLPSLASQVAQMVKRVPVTRETGFDPW